MPIDAEGRDALIRTIYGEAGNQGPQGWAAVAHVIKNRVDSHAWSPKDAVLPVIHAQKQFSMYNTDSQGNMNPRGVAATHLSASDPAYERIGNVVDGVFNGQIPDPTQGATHFFNPAAVDQFPPWAAEGHNIRRIGDHLFMTVPLTMDSTGGTILTSYHPGADANSDANVARDRAFLASVSAHPDRPGDTANMDPVFAAKLAAAIRAARAEGIAAGVGSGFRTPGQTGSAYDAAGDSSHTYGFAADISGIGQPGSATSARWHAIAEANGIHNPYWGGNPAEWNHYQLSPNPLEVNQPKLAAMKAAYAAGDWAKVWSLGESGSSVGSYPASSTPAGQPLQLYPAPDQPAPAAQPVLSTQPPASAVQSAASPQPLAGSVAASGQNPPASAAGASGASGQNPRFPLLQFGGTGAAGINRPQYVSSINLTPGNPPASSSAPTGAASTLPASVQANPPSPPVRPSPEALASTLPASVQANPPLPPLRPSDAALTSTLPANVITNPPRPPQRSPQQTAGLSNLLSLLFPQSA